MANKHEHQREGDDNSAELQTKWFSFRWGKNVRVSEIMSFILLGILVWAASLLYHHSKGVDTRWNEMLASFKALQDTQNETTQSQRELNYIITLPPEAREKLNLQMPDSLRKRLRQREEVLGLAGGGNKYP